MFIVALCSVKCVFSNRNKMSGVNSDLLHRSTLSVYNVSLLLLSFKPRSNENAH